MTTIHGELRKEDIGSVIELIIKVNDVALDISQAITKQIVLKNPAGTSVTKTAVFSGDGTDGKLRYVTVTNDLASAGLWQAQAKIVLPSGTWKSEILNIKVWDNL